jgi:hypothetical protein
MHLFRSVLYLTLTFTFALISMGQVVSVNKVKFTSLNDDWLMSEIEIATGRNTLPDAVSERFIENVGIRLYLGFKNDNLDGGVDFYYSEVTAHILERGDKNTVRFFIPGKEIEMNRYNKPLYYYAEIIVNQKPVSPKSRAFSSRFQSEDSLKNFVKKAKVGSVKNLGRLIPSYLAPRDIVGSDSDAPAYLRMNN